MGITPTAQRQQVHGRQRSWRRQRQCAVKAADGPCTGSGSSRPPAGLCAPPLVLLAARPPQPPPATPAAFLAAGTVGNAAMAAAGAALGTWQGLGVGVQLTAGDLSLPAAAAFMLPLGGLCVWGVRSADSVQGFAEMRALFRETLIPQLQILPGWVREWEGGQDAEGIHRKSYRSWLHFSASAPASSRSMLPDPLHLHRPPHPQGLCLLAFGAGVGEETLFRAFMQSACIEGIAGAAPALPHTAAAAAGLAATSLVFGALHALTPTYFYFATAAGALFVSWVYKPH